MLRTRMKKYIKYLNYVVRHKWYVFLECCKVGLFWRGIKHDWHKLLPSEFFPYADFFYKKQPRDKTGYYKASDTGHKGFDYAWFLHQKRADHHWQWWMMPQDAPLSDKLLPMSHKARLEMFCDWKGANKAQKTSGVPIWYKANKDKLQLHPDTRAWVEKKLKEMENDEIKSSSNN